MTRKAKIEEAKRKINIKERKRKKGGNGSRSGEKLGRGF